jgi:Thymosin beta-4 family
MSDAPLSPSLKDLPKVASDLKSELQDFNTESMKTVNTTEKNVLPTAQGINAAARTHEYLCRRSRTNATIEINKYRWCVARSGILCKLVAQSLFLVV